MSLILGTGQDLMLASHAPRDPTRTKVVRIFRTSTSTLFVLYRLETNRLIGSDGSFLYFYIILYKDPFCALPVPLECSI